MEISRHAATHDSLIVRSLTYLEPQLSRWCAALALLTVLHGVQAQTWPAAVPGFHSGFPVAFGGANDYVRSSSPAFADLDGDGKPDIVIGTADGKVYAYKGNGTRLWVVNTGTVGIDSKPAIGDVDADGFPEVVVGMGTTFAPQGNGGVMVISRTGQVKCSFQTQDFDNDGFRDGVYSTPSLANLNHDPTGKLKIVFGSWDFHIYALNSDCTIYWVKSFSDLVLDSTWSSPAIGDLLGDGELEVVIGTDSHFDPGLGTQDGGILHAFRGTGNGEIPGFPIKVDEVIYSSPALGDINGDGHLDIIVGTGRCWDIPCVTTRPAHAVTEVIYAFDRFGNALPGWPAPITGEYAQAAPALADIDGDGTLDVVVNTFIKGQNAGRVHVFKGNGAELAGWPRSPMTPANCTPPLLAHSFPTLGSPIVADLDNDGHAEIIVASGIELVIWDRFGNQLSRSTGCTYPPTTLQVVTNSLLGSTAGAADLDGNGKVELVVGSATTFNGTAGALYAWDFQSPFDIVHAPWAEFRRNARNYARVDLDSIFSNGFQ